MPYYKDNQFFKQINALGHPQFYTTFSSGTPAPKAGIYRCKTCGHEIGIAEGHLLPPSGTREHPYHEKGHIGGLLTIALDNLWELVAQARHVHDEP